MTEWRSCVCVNKCRGFEEGGEQHGREEGDLEDAGPYDIDATWVSPVQLVALNSMPCGAEYPRD